MIDPIRRLLALAKIVLVDDTKKTQTAQLNLGPALPDGSPEIHDNAYVLNPYGFTSNPPKDTTALILFLNAQRSLGLVVGCRYASGRPTGLQPGEAAFFNALTGKILKLGANGQTTLNGDFLVTGNISATGTITARTGGTVAELGAVRDAYVAHKHSGVQTGGAISGPSDHTSV